MTGQQSAQELAEPGPQPATERGVILAATSLAPASDPVVDTAVELSRHLDAELHLLHAYPLPVAYLAAPSGLVSVEPAMFDKQHDLAQGLLAEQLRRLEIAPETIDEATIQGGAAHRLTIERARELDADLIVVGASDDDEVHLLGSTAERIVRQAARPVWVVRGKPQLPPAKILLPVDLSPICADSMRRGLQLLHDMGAGGAQVEALFVLSSTEIQHDEQQTPLEQIDRWARSELVGFLDKIPDVPASTKHSIRVGPVRREIRRHIEETAPDLVILGTHGRGGFERLLLGSIATDVVREVRSSVLVVPPEES